MAGAPLGSGVELMIEDERWTAVDLDAMLERAVPAVLARLGIAADDVELAVLACADARIAELNGEFRGKSAPTNVLSWPAQELRPPDVPEPDPDGTVPLGDIALAFETCEREAADQGKPFGAHVTHLIVHGTLHLLGYDHEDDHDARMMERLEIEILCNLGLPDPYS